MAFILWIIAVIIAIYGILRLVRGDILIGIVLLVVAALVGPGGYSIFSSDSVTKGRAPGARPFVMSGPKRSSLGLWRASSRSTPTTRNSDPSTRRQR